MDMTMVLFLLTFFAFLAVASMRGWVADSRENRDWRFAGRGPRDLGANRP
jgi:hypothetical protein